MRWLPAAAVLLISVSATHAEQWTRFRGPNGTGVGETASIPASWTADDYNWRVELPGIGHSSPVLWGERIFLTSAIPETAERILLCLHVEDGRVLWKQSYPSKVHPKHDLNSFATPTPACDEQHAYFVWSTPDEYTLVALDHDGHEKWKLDLGPYTSMHSAGPSPIVYRDLVILGNDQDGESSLLAFDRLSSALRWQTSRRAETVSYSTPCVLSRAGLPDELIFLSAAHGMSGIDPETGKTNWELDVFDKRTVASPIIADGLVLGSCGSGGGGTYAVAVRPGTPDGASQPEQAWKITDAAPYVPTMLARNGLIFMWSDKGIASCVRAETGKVVWKQRLGGNFYGSPVCVDDRLYCIAENGDVVVIAANDEFKLLGRNPLNEDSRSTPAVAGGRMYLRTNAHLISIGRKKRED